MENPYFYFFLVRQNFLKDFIYLFLERGREKKKERERNINVWLPLTCLPPETWLATQACALTRNRTSNPLLCSLVLNPLSHTSQVYFINATSVYKQSNFIVNA